MSLFSISQERVDLTKAQFAYAREFRKATFWHKTANVVLNLPLRALAFSPINFVKFDTDEYVEAHPDSALAAARGTLENTARRYAAFRSSIKRIIPDSMRKSEYLRAMFEIGRAKRLASLSTLERIPGNLIRLMFGNKWRALGSATALAALLFLTPVGKGVAVKLGSIHTKDVIGLGFFGGVRTTAANAEYIARRVDEITGNYKITGDLMKDASTYANNSQFWRDAVMITGVTGGFAIREYFADAVANWFHLSSPDELVRQTIPNTRENLLVDINAKRGIPEFIPATKGHTAAALDTALSETGIVRMAREQSPILHGMYERLALLREGKSILINKFKYEDLLADGEAHLKRLETLEAARVRYEALMKDGVPDTVTVQFLQKSLADLAKEREAAKEWSDVFDIATNEASEQNAHDHSGGLVWLLARYAITHHVNPLDRPEYAELFPAPPHIPEFPMTSGNLNLENFSATYDLVSFRLEKINEILKAGRLVMGTNSETYADALQAHDAYAAMLSRLNTLRPSFENFTQIQSSVGPYASHANDDLSYALLRDQVRQVPFADAHSIWAKAVHAAESINSVKAGTVVIDGRTLSIGDADTIPLKDGVFPDLPPSLAHTVYELNVALKEKGIDALILSEGFHPMTDIHHSTCHYDGTCVDLAFTDKNYSPARIAEIFKTTDELDGNDTVIFEMPNAAEREAVARNLRAFLLGQGMDAAQVEQYVARVKHVPWGTAPHFHFDCKACQPEGTPPLVVSANDNEPLFVTRAA